ncbi:MAG TPA: SDR family NAD(P)-dependent oxidoreductase [Caulobacteraceae bacterium]|nr:SDR family NAD(P)-dependent oxidoreductase [Caulobacteraceae bacterium]
MISIAPRTIVITGCSSRLGQAVAQLFARQGWNVVAATGGGPADATLAGLPAVVTAAVDPGDLGSVEAAVGAGVQRFGGIAGLVNVIGFGLELAAPDNREIFAALDMTRAVLPHLRRRGGGVIVNVAPRSGYGLDAAPCPAVESLTERLEAELAPLGVAVRRVDAAATTRDDADDALLGVAEGVYRSVVQPVPAWPAPAAREPTAPLRPLGAGGE